MQLSHGEDEKVRHDVANHSARLTADLANHSVRFKPYLAAALTVVKYLCLGAKRRQDRTGQSPLVVALLAHFLVLPGIDDQGDAPVQRTMQSTVINLQDFAEVEERPEREEQREKELEELTIVKNQPPFNGIAE